MATFEGYPWRQPYTAQQLEDAQTNQVPIIGPNNHWWRWDISTNAFVDTGIGANPGTDALPDGSVTWEKLSQEARHSNPNLLDNWYFLNPINQREQTEYTGTGYTIDRWYATSALTVLVESDHITIKNTGTSKAYFLQRSERSLFSALAGKETVRSLLYQCDSENCNIYSTYTVGSIITFGNVKLASDGLLHAAESVSNVPQVSATAYEGLGVGVAPGATVQIYAVKLELGTEQTLAHQENGNWVLNDPPPDYGTELAKCQRYYFKWHVTQFTTIGNFYARNRWINLALGTGTEMRTPHPTAKLTGNIAMVTGAIIEPDIISNFTNSTTSGTMQNIGIAATVTANGSGYMYAADVGGCDIEIDANL